jgi:two-component system, chemotaxis family, CheB/CheR fusion protein
MSQHDLPDHDGPPYTAHDPAPVRAPAMVVGVGASAGGIPALKEFFHDIPDDTGAAFVVVLHLSPDFESRLAEVLQAHVRMPVRRVDGRVRMAADCIYVIPQNRTLLVSDGHLEVGEPADAAARRSTIDYFFRSLAEHHPDCVGVLLSGAGSDGALGLAAIRDGGGLTLAQEPGDAEYAEMPQAAVARGVVDFVLPARQLGAKLVELRSSLQTQAPPLRDSPLDESAAAALSSILLQVKTRTGHDVSGYKQSTLLRRIGRRMRVRQVGELPQYADLLRSNRDEPGALLKDLLISVTSFFRDPEVFGTLADLVVPELLAGVPAGDTVRVWVPGCATGEEAYSIAMVLHEHAMELKRPPPVQIFASDLDADAIAAARQGEFPATVAADVGADRVERYFIERGAFLRVRKEVREMILFTTHNLLQDPPFSRIDLVSCRNVLIYLERHLQEQVFDLFHYALRENGTLVLGGSESIAGDPARFRVLHAGHRIYQRESSPRQRPRLLPDLPLAPQPRVPPDRDPAPAARRGSGAADADLHRSVLEAHAPPSIVVDHNGGIVHVSDSAGRYLLFPSGSPTSNLLKATREELRPELRTALHHVLTRRASFLSPRIPVVLDGRERAVQVYAAPATADGAQLALVVFMEGDAPADEAEQSTFAAPSRRAQEADEEIGALHDRLQQTVEDAALREEELKAANEELQSINEEYRSTLEELETSREELQSMNEELTSVNDELKLRVEQLARANDDLSNLMSSTEIATLFLDRELNIQRFTPALQSIFNVMPIDVGRRLSDLTHRLDQVSFPGDCQHVLNTLQPIQREVMSEEGSTFLMRITPYRTGGDSVDGLVITFTDITAIRHAESKLRESEERHRLLIEGVQEYAIFMIDQDGLITLWNAGAERTFGWTGHEIIGRSAEVIFIPQDRAAGVLLQEMQAALRDGQAPDDRWHLRRSGEQFWASGTLTALRAGDGTLRGYAKVLRDNTQRRQQEEALRQSEAGLRALTDTLEERVEERTAELAAANLRARALASEVVLAEQRVRRYIARRLHDDLQQHLYGVQMRVAALRQRDTATDDPSGTLADIAQWLAEAVKMTRGLTLDISPPALAAGGLADGVQWLADQMQEAHGLHVDVHDASGDAQESEDVRTLILESLRELLFNIVKHAELAEAVVEIERVEGRIVVHVSDEGPGFRAVEPMARSLRGFGLANVAERLRLLGGDMRIDSAPGRATRITLVAPPL